MGGTRDTACVPYSTFENQTAAQLLLAHGSNSAGVKTEEEGSMAVLTGSRRFLFVIAVIATIIIFALTVSPVRVTTWPTSNILQEPYENYFNAHKTAPGVPEPSSTSIASAAPSLPSSHDYEVARPVHSSVPQDGDSPQQSDTVDRYNVVFGSRRSDKKYIPIDFGDYFTYNPNLVPHPWKEDTWVMIAQAGNNPGDVQGLLYSFELVCNAMVVNGTLKCNRTPVSAPIASTVSTHCVDHLDWFNTFIGPRDARVFHGPDKPYITYGSPSQYTCIGQWIHDLRRLVPWNEMSAIDSTQRFFWPTELQRPGSYADTEKNWFAFWDRAGEMYLHYEIAPRVFSKVSADGSSVSEDLAPLAAGRDEVCLRTHLPELKESEHFHQATNSLAITMCKRSDSSCDERENTFIFTIFHHKQYYGHNIYEPYIMMFKQEAPFSIHAISSQPFWINGRGKPGDRSDDERPADQPEMMYMTSMSWLAKNNTYHGYLDDELWLSFGIEDTHAGAIDVIAEDLLRGMLSCS